MAASRDIYDGNDYAEIPVITDAKVFGYETNTLNFLTPMIRSPEHGHIFYDDLYVVHFQIKERNTRNKSLYNSFKSSGRREMIPKLIESNYEIINEGEIDSFWKIFRNSDYSLAKVSKNRTGMTFFTTKAFVFPCYVGDVNSGDASAAHVVLFVAYVDKSVRQIWMYDSLIHGDTPKKVPRFDYRSINSMSKLKFTHNESEYEVGIQKIFHLIESYVHCLELLESYNDDDSFSIPKKDRFSQQPITHFKPSSYKFYITGYGPDMKQKGFNCSAFTVHGMYNLLRRWTNPTLPHKMEMHDYSEIYQFPLLTYNQFVAGNVCAFINKTVIFDKRTSFQRNISIFITTNSGIDEDHTLRRDIYNTVSKNINYFVQILDVHTISTIDAEISSIDTVSKKDVIIFVYDRIHDNMESVRDTKLLLEKFIATTKTVVIVYPGQVIQYITSIKPAFDSNVFSDFGMITYPMSPKCSDIFRHSSDAITLMNTANMIDINIKGNRFVHFTDLPPTSITHFIKVLDGGFVPFTMSLS